MNYYRNFRMIELIILIVILIILAILTVPMMFHAGEKQKKSAVLEILNSASMP